MTVSSKQISDTIVSLTIGQRITYHRKITIILNYAEGALLCTDNTMFVHKLSKSTVISMYHTGTATDSLTLTV